MSNSTNVTYAVSVVPVEVSPKLKFNPISSNVDLSYCLILANNNALVIKDQNGQNVSISLPAVGGKTNQPISLTYNLDEEISNFMNLNSDMQGLQPNEQFSTQSSKPFTVNSYNMELLPIITINGFSVISFDEWWSLFSFDSSIPNDTISTIKQKLSDAYPDTLNLKDYPYLADAINLVSNLIKSGSVSYNDIISSISSCKILGDFINPDKVMHSRVVNSIPFGKLVASYTIPDQQSTVKSFRFVKQSLDSMPYGCFGNGLGTRGNGNYYLAKVTDGITYDPGCNPFGPTSWPNGNPKLTQPTVSGMAGWWSNSFNQIGGFFPNLDGVVSTPGDGLSGIYTALTSFLLPQGSSVPQCSPQVTPSLEWSLFNTTWWSGFKLGTEWQFGGNNLSGEQGNWVPSGTGIIASYVTPMVFPYYEGWQGHILFDNSVELTENTSLWNKVIGVALVVNGNTGEQVFFNIPYSSMQCATYFLRNTNSALWTTQFQDFGVSFNTSSATITTQTGEPFTYSLSVTPMHISDWFSVSSIYSNSVYYSQLNIVIDDTPNMKEIIQDAKDPFESIADKILTLRDEFNAKVFNDINCKVMNFPKADDVVNNFPSTITFMNSDHGSQIPNQSVIYTALAPIFLGALNLGIYFKVVNESYTCWPFTSVPPYFQLAWNNFSVQNNLGYDFQWTPNQLTMLINWLFMLPSPTSVKATAYSVQRYTLNPSFHVFRTSNKSVTRNVPKHKLIMNQSSISNFDPSINEVKYTMNALEDMATCLMAASTAYTVSKSSESMLSSLLSRHKLGSIEEMATSSDPNVKDLYDKFSQWWTQVFHAKNNSVSSQHDDYKTSLFIPDSSHHKTCLEHHIHNLHSIFDAISLSTFHNSDILQQVSQYASNTFTKYHDSLLTTMGKLGTDLLAEDSIKLLDHAVEDVVKDSINIAADVGKVILNMCADILATGEDLMSPVSVVSQLYSDITEHIYNGFSQVPDVNSKLYSETATPGIAWSFSLASFPDMISVGKNKELLPIWPTVDKPFLTGGQVGPNYAWENLPVKEEFTDSSIYKFPYTAYSWMQFNQAVRNISIRYDKISTNKPARFEFHTASGKAFIYLINGIQFNSNSWIKSNNFMDVVVMPEPVTNYLGVIDPLSTYKKYIEVIYQLPRLFGCEGLFDYLYYKDLWQTFIDKVGSQAWTNQREHISIGETIAADSAGLGMFAGFTGYAVADGFSFEWANMIENGAVGITDLVETVKFNHNVDQINSEPTILSSQYQGTINQFISIVLKFIYDWKYAMGGFILNDLSSHPKYFRRDLIDLYSEFCSQQLSENEKNRKLVSLLNDHFYGLYDVQDKDWAISTVPMSNDFSYDPENFGLFIDCNKSYRWTNEQIGVTSSNSSGNLSVMEPVYSPSTVEDFMYITAGLGRIAAGAYLEKRVSRLFLSHAKLSSKVAYIRAKVAKITDYPKKLGKWIGSHAAAKYHRDHNSKARQKLISTQTKDLEATLTQQTNTLAEDINGMGNDSNIVFGLH